MAWINKDAVVAALVRVAVVEVVVKQSFGRFAENYEVVQSVESYTLGLRDLRTNEIIVQREYDPNAEIKIGDLLLAVDQLRVSLGIPPQ